MKHHTDDGSGSDFVITREWTVTDDVDNTAIFTQTVNVILEGCQQQLDNRFVYR